jgi:tight adherence protein C
MTALLLFVIFILLAVAGFIFFFNVMPDFEKLNLSKRFVDDLGAGREAPALMKIFRLPIIIFSDMAAGMKMPRQREKYAQHLQGLGMEKVVTADQVIALKLVLTAIASVYALLLLVSGIPWFFGLLLLFFGWIYVDMWLRDKVTKRRRDIVRQLPFLLDMLTLSVEAGLEFTAAVAKIVSKMDPSPLREELTIFLRQMQLGMSRRDALRAMADRLKLPQINSMTSSLIQAAEMGSSIGSALRTQSEIMNAERFVEAEKKGAEASQKMLFPMVVFIIPATMMVILGPLILSYIYNRGSF